MGKVIKGKRYDIETSTVVGVCEYGKKKNEEYYRETVYRKRTGEYFLYGEGGPASRYAKSQGNNKWTNGNRTIPMSDEDARNWVREHMTESDYERIFCEEDGNAETQISFKVTVREREAVKNAAKAKGVTQLEIFREWIKSLLNHTEGKQ